MPRGRRHSTGFGYIGFGNSQATFNQSSKKAFSKYKEKLDFEDICIIKWIFCIKI